MSRYALKRHFCSLSQFCLPSVCKATLIQAASHALSVISPSKCWHMQPRVCLPDWKRHLLCLRITEICNAAVELSGEDREWDDHDDMISYLRCLFTPNWPRCAVCQGSPYFLLPQQCRWQLRALCSWFIHAVFRRGTWKPRECHRGQPDGDWQGPAQHPGLERRLQNHRGRSHWQVFCTHWSNH